MARLVFASYNIRRGIGRDGRQDSERILEVLRHVDADVVALQEVLWEDGEPLTRLSETLGMTFAEGAALRIGKGQYGNVLLVRGRILRTARHDLSVPSREPRCALEASVEVSGVSGRVIATHLGLTREERRAQVERLGHLVNPDGGAGGGPEENVALMGDVNEWLPWCQAVRQPSRWFGPHPSARSYPTPVPVLAIDRIWARPRGSLRALSAVRTPESRVASDHFPVRAEIRWAG